MKGFNKKFMEECMKKYVYAKLLWKGVPAFNPFTWAFIKEV